jgi:hypothetical protein
MSLPDCAAFAKYGGCKPTSKLADGARRRGGAAVNDWLRCGVPRCVGDYDLLLND